MQSTKEVTKKWFWKIYIYIYFIGILLSSILFGFCLFFYCLINGLFSRQFQIRFEIVAMCFFVFIFTKNNKLFSRRLISCFFVIIIVFLDKALSQKHIRRRIHTRTFILNQTYTYCTRYTHKYNHSTLKRTQISHTSTLSFFFIKCHITSDHDSPQMLSFII